MTTNCPITLYHFSNAEKIWKRSFIPCANVYCRFGSSASAGDFSPDNHCVIRIPFYAKAEIAVGDYVYIGRMLPNEPDYASCLKVTSFCLNDRGSSPHLKILCS